MVLAVEGKIPYALGILGQWQRMTTLLVQLNPIFSSRFLNSWGTLQRATALVSVSLVSAELALACIYVDICRAVTITPLQVARTTSAATFLIAA